MAHLLTDQPADIRDTLLRLVQDDAPMVMPLAQTSTLRTTMIDHVSLHCCEATSLRSLSDVDGPQTMETPQCAANVISVMWLVNDP